MDAEEGEAALKHWREVVDSRDQLFRDAFMADVSINRISALTGVARTTIYDILGDLVPTKRAEKARERAAAKKAADKKVPTRRGKPSRPV